MGLKYRLRILKDNKEQMMTPFTMIAMFVIGILSMIATGWHDKIFLVDIMEELLFPDFFLFKEEVTGLIVVGAVVLIYTVVTNTRETKFRLKIMFGMYELHEGNVISTTKNVGLGDEIRVEGLNVPVHTSRSDINIGDKLYVPLMQDKMSPYPRVLRFYTIEEWKEI